MFGRRARWENNNDNWNRRRERENELEQERNWPNENENNERWRLENERRALPSQIKVNDDVYTLIQAIINNVITDNFDEFLYDETNPSDTERVVRLGDLTYPRVSRQYITQNINMTFIEEGDRDYHMYNPVPGYTLLYAAVFADNVRLARKLIESYDADTNALIQPRYDDNQEVYPAIFHCKSVEMLNLLHEHGAIIGGTFPGLTYPSILFNYSYKYFESKKDQRVSPDEEFTNGLFNILKRIIELGTDINSVNSDGSTVLHLYPTYGLAKLLLDDEYRVIRRTRIFNIHANNFAGDSIIHSVTADVRLVDYYNDEAIFDLNRLNRRNRNMLFAYVNVLDELEFNRDASRYNGYNIIDIRDAMYKWIEYGANINQLDIHGLCPLFIAKSDTVIDMLLKTRNMDTLPEENRIDIKIKNEFGRNKAFYMYNSMSLRIFNTALESPSEISEFYSTLDNDNSNALYYTWNKDLFELLLSYGLDMYHINNRGESIIFGFYKSIFDWDWTNQISRTISFIIEKSRRDGKSDDIFKRNDNNGRNIVHCVVIQMYIVLMLNAYVNNEAFFKRIYDPMYRKFYNTYNDGWDDNDKFSISSRDSILSISLIFLKNSGVTEFGSTDKCNNNIFSYIGFYEQFNKLREHMDYIGDIDYNGVYNDRIEGEGGEIITCEFDDYPSEDVRIQFLYPGDNILIRCYNYDLFNKMESDHRIIVREYIYVLEGVGVNLREIYNYQTPRTGNTVMHEMLTTLIDKHDTAPSDILYDIIEIKPSVDLTITNNDGKTAVDLARDYIETYNDNAANQLSRIFSLGTGIFNKPYNGICKDTLDMQMADFFTATNEELGGEHGKKRIYFSHCPVCLEPVGRTSGCVYMTHNCSEINKNIYHVDLYEKFNVSGMIEWCTICGRITHNHYHYALLPHDTPKSEFTDHPIPAGMPTHDYWNCPGGNGVKEKVARMLKLREKYIEASEFVGVKTNAGAVYPIIEAVFDAPLQEGLLDAGQAALDAGVWPSEIPELRCEGVKPAKEKRIKPYEVPADLVIPEFVEVGDNEYTYTGFDVPLWKFNHVMENGEEHPNVGENVVIMHLVGRGERLGLCPVRECGALFYPEEADTVLRGEGEGEIDNTVDLHEEYSVAPAGTTKRGLADSYRSFFTGQYYKIAGKPVEYIEGENEEEDDTAMCSLPRVEVAEPAVEPVAGENGNELPALEPVPGRGNNENGAPQEGGKRRRVKGTKRVHKKGGRKTIRRGKGGVLRKMPKKAAKTLYKKTNVKNAMKSKRRRV